MYLSAATYLIKILNTSQFWNELVIPARYQRLQSKMIEDSEKRKKKKREFFGGYSLYLWTKIFSMRLGLDFGPFLDAFDWSNVFCVSCVLFFLEW